MSRKLVAALACRANGSRLYGKPLQNLYADVTILDQIVAAIHEFEFIDDIVLGISEGSENLVFIDKAHKLNCRYIVGDPIDVLSRLVSCGRHVNATDVFRVTTECPWFDYSMLETAWRQHVDGGYDISVLDHVPEGAGFEIYTLNSLERSHEEGLDDDRSEFCSNYARFNQERFKINILKPEEICRRLDYRLTVDYPEDLVVCRKIYHNFKGHAPLVALKDIIKYLDEQPELMDMLSPYIDQQPVWDGQPQRMAQRR